MFGNDSLPSKIYSYGAKSPHINGHLIDEQILLAHRYWNKLTEIERNRRERVAAVLESLCPKIQSLTTQWGSLGTQIDELRTAVKARKAAARGKVDAKIEREQIRELSAQRKAVYVELKTAKADAFADPAFISAQQTIDTESNDTRKAARAESGLYWANYLSVEQSAGSMRSGAPPEFRRWYGEADGTGTDGKISVQVQGGIPANEIFGSDSRVRVTIAGTGKQPWATLQIRVGSDGRNPVFAALRFRMHRPLPEGSTVKWVYVTRRMISTHAEWRVQFVVSRAGGFERPDACNAGSVGIDVGWRLVPEGLRVAYWVGDDGREGQLVIPRDSLDRWRKATDLRSIEDREFDAQRDRLADWIATHTVPGWLTESTQAIRQWRSAQRLSRIIVVWREQRFDGDTEIFDQCEAWRKQHRHLYDWEGFQRIGANRWRDDLFRKFAAKMRREYRVACIEKINLSELRTTPEPEDDAISDGLIKYRNIASPGRLLALVAESMTEVVRRDPKNTTRSCNECGHTEPAAIDSIVHTCGGCSATWDQDRNAAVNLLRGTPASGPVMEKDHAPLA